MSTAKENLCSEESRRGLRVRHGRHGGYEFRENEGDLVVAGKVTPKPSTVMRMLAGSCLAMALTSANGWAWSPYREQRRRPATPSPLISMPAPA